MPPDRESPYGQPYRDPYGDGQGGDPYGRRSYGQDAAPEEDPYTRSGDFQAAVDALSDPLSDPLPGQGTPQSGRGERISESWSPPYPEQGHSSQGWSQQGHQQQGYPAAGHQSPGHASGAPGHQQQGHRTPGYDAQGPGGGQAQQDQSGVSPWFRPHRDAGPAGHDGQQGSPVVRPLQQGRGGQVPYGSAQSAHTAPPVLPQRPRRQRPGGSGVPPTPGQPQSGPSAEWGHDAVAPDRPAPTPQGGSAPRGRRGAGPAGARGGLSETASLPVADGPGEGGNPAGPRPTGRSAAAVDEDDEYNTITVGLRRADQEELRRAARRHSARHGKGGSQEVHPTPGTRLEARRAARARREGPAIIASRFLGEVFISAGVLMLLFVAYQLWWTNVLAGQEAGGAAQDLEEQWQGGDGSGKGGLDPERRADDFAPGEGFALLYIPKLDVKVPIAQGISKPKVLDKGLVGHYDEEPVKSAMPWDKKGNFAVAGHRNTHGEPFRYVNRLVGGDKIVVETATKFYTYEMANRLPSTPPSNTGVIKPIPAGSGFNESGRYITLTTCTPEFTSKYRLIVWGKMVEERPRSKGKPDALVGG